MLTKALNKNNDLIQGSNGYVTISGAAKVMQMVRSRLLHYMGDWMLDIESGIPYMQEHFDRPSNLVAFEQDIKDTILNTEGVKELTSFEMSFDRIERKITIRFSGITTFGEINNEEVFLNV